jgi:hypothetical protein
MPKGGALPGLVDTYKEGENDTTVIIESWYFATKAL